MVERPTEGRLSPLGQSDQLLRCEPLVLDGAERMALAVGESSLCNLRSCRVSWPVGVWLLVDGEPLHLRLFERLGKSCERIQKVDLVRVALARRDRVSDVHASLAARA